MDKREKVKNDTVELSCEYGVGECLEQSGAKAASGFLSHDVPGSAVI
jgi:hypothetical protein